jgi:hypothetical protein
MCLYICIHTCECMHITYECWLRCSDGSSALFWAALAGNEEVQYVHLYMHAYICMHIYVYMGIYAHQ